VIHAIACFALGVLLVPVPIVLLAFGSRWALRRVWPEETQADWSNPGILGLFASFVIGLFFGAGFVGALILIYAAGRAVLG
jgi:hypothetical protein